MRAPSCHGTVLHPHTGMARQARELVPQEQPWTKRSWWISFLTNWVMTLGYVLDLEHLLKVPQKSEQKPACSLGHPTIGCLPFPASSPTSPTNASWMASQINYLKSNTCLRPPAQGTQIKDRSLLYLTWIKI